MTANNNLTIGWAWRDITPPGPINLAGQFYTRIAHATADPVTTTALAIESVDADGHKQQAVIVSCDLVYVPENTLALIRQQVEPELPDLDPLNILASATHTHTGPTLNADFYPPEDPPVLTPAQSEQHVAAQVAQAVIEAWRSRQPGRIANAFTHAVVAQNRRPSYFDGSTQMYGDTSRDDFEAMEGYEDHSLNLLFTFDLQSRLTGAVVNLACPSQVSEHGDQTSADFWYETRNTIRQRLNQDIPILGQCSAAGDQSPHHLLMKNLEKTMRERKNVSERQEIADRITRALIDTLDTAKNHQQSQPAVHHHIETLDLPVRRVTDEEYQAAREEIAKIATDPEMEASRKHNHTRRNQAVVDRYQVQNERPTLPMELHVLKIGDVVMATNPFELFLDFGLRIKARARSPHTFIIQLACGCHGYLPTRKAVERRSYGAEVASNKVGPEGGQVLVDRTVEQINQLFQ